MSPRAVLLADEVAYCETLIAGAQQFGWLTFHQRPAQRGDGSWRSAVSGDGAGFPDLVLVHPVAHELWFVEVKRDDAPISLPRHQEAWRVALTRAGFKHHIWRVPSELNRCLGDLRDVARTKAPGR